MSFFSKIWKVVKKVAPVAIGYALTGTPIGAAVGGAAGSALRGGNLTQILQGAGYGYGAGSALGGLSSAAAGAAGAGGGAAGDAAFQSALNGTGTFGAADAIANGGIGGAIANAAPSLYNLPNTLSNAGASIGNFVSNPVQSLSSILKGGTSLASNNITGSFGSGSGGLLTNGTPSAALGASSLADAGAGGGSSIFGGSGGTLLNLLGTANQLSSQDKAKNDLLASQKTSLAENAPFLASGTAANNMLADRLGTSGNTGAAGYGDLTSEFTPGDLTKDPGYQFQLDQGTQAMNRANAAAGNLDSGAALKEAQKFGTGLADNTYNAAFQRWLQNNAQNYDALAGQTNTGLTAAGNAAQVNNNIGMTKALTTQAKGNTLTSLLAGAGARTIIGYTQDGKPIYS